MYVPAYIPSRDVCEGEGVQYSRHSDESVKISFGKLSKALISSQEIVL
jgi:hypothetical protein